MKRELVMDRLQAMGIGLPIRPGGAFYAFADLCGLPAGLDDGMEFFRAALERKVIVVPGEFFDVNPGQRRRHLPSRLKNFVRLSYGPSIESVELGLERLAAMIAEYSQRAS